MAETLAARVVVVGSGPVGMTLAMDLAWRGIDVVVVERRRAGETPPVKANSISARTMEIFRRLGVAAKVRAGGLPHDYPQSASYRTTTTGYEMARIPMPSTAERYTFQDGPDANWPTPEPQHHMNQTFLEPILFEHLTSMANARVLNRVEVEGLEQDADGVTVLARNLESGQPLQLRCEYMIGCDGGRSLVRKAIGATFSGEAVIQRVQSTFIRAPKLIGLMPAGPAWAMTSFNPRRCGNVYAIDGHETFLIFNYLKESEKDFESVDREECIRKILGVPDGFEFEIVRKEDWIGRRLMADRFRDRRVFICGDAAHIWVPYGGYGMNAGIADAANLTWLLWAHLTGWAPASILDAHEAERLPVTEQVSHFAMGSAFKAIKMRREVPAGIEDPGPAGAAIRAEIGQEAYNVGITRLCSAGLNFGYFYTGSPIIAYDGEEPPGYTMSTFTSSTVPGCRVPHLWLRDGTSLYDALGAGYTLLRFDARIDATALAEAARARGVPLKILDVDAADAADVYRHALVLARPDQHVAWRGDAVPADPLALVDLIRGARTEAPATAARTREPAGALS